MSLSLSVLSWNFNKQTIVQSSENYLEEFFHFSTLKLIFILNLELHQRGEDQPSRFLQFEIFISDETELSLKAEDKISQETPLLSSLAILRLRTCNYEL